MAKNAISDYSSTAASNTDVGGVDIQGSAAASNMDDAVRELMSHLADAAFGASVSLTSTDAGATIGPTLDLYRNSASPADSDVIGGITFSGEDDGGNKTEYARIQASIGDTTDTTEDGTLTFAIMKAGTSETILTLNPNTVTVTPTASSALALINTSDDTYGFILQGGNTASQGAQIFVYGDAHATNANDIRFVSGNVLKMMYDASDGQWEIADTTPMMFGSWSITGASAGSRITDNLLVSSNTGTGATTHQAYYNANGNVGGISLSGSTTTFATSSDERLKDFIGIYDPQKAIEIIRADPVRDFTWKRDGKYAVGWGAQTSYAVSKDLATEMLGGTWGIDQGKRTPYLWAALTWALDKIEDLEARLAAIESIP